MFAQDDVHTGAVSPGQVLAVPLQPGETTFIMNWEELLDLPTSRVITFAGDPTGPIYFVIRELNILTLKPRSVEPVSRGAFLAAVQNARVAEDTAE